MITLDRTTAYALRATLIAVLRLIEDALRLPDEERALRPPRRQKAA